MSVSYLSFKNISVSFGDTQLFQGVSFNVLENERICLVGRNGSGKTTLMKAIAGEIEPDTGENLITSGVVVGYLRQKLPDNTNQKVYDYVLGGLPIEQRENYKADIVLEPLGITGDMDMSILSGGQLRRTDLARALISEPQLLLLDEPTNHLDIGAIEWLENYIKAYRGSIICISHDRTFLSNISNKTLFLDRGTMFVNGRGYKDFERWQSALLEEEEKRLIRLGKKVDRENHWLTYGVTARRKRNVQRLGSLYELRDKLKRERNVYNQGRRTVQLPLLSPSQKNKLVIDMQGISKKFGDNNIIGEFSTRIMKGDKVGIIGNNGSGKSTFLNIFAGMLETDSGIIKRGLTQIKFEQQISYFDQNRESLNPKKTLWETLCPDGGDYVKSGDSHRHVVSYLKDFMFDPKDAKMPVAMLSGGQSNRLLLAKVLMNPGSILILDEPTNDLDIETLDMLEEMLSDYKGTILLVSHDRDFLDKTVDRVIAFEGDGIVDEFVGGYNDYLSQRTVRGSSPKAIELKDDKKSEKPKSINVKLSFKYQHALDTLPQKISDEEEKISQLEEKLADANLFSKNPDDFYKFTKDLESCKGLIIKYEEEWMEAEMKREELLS